MASVLGMNKRSQAAVLLVGINDLDALAVLLLDDRVVGVGQTESQFAAADRQGDLLVAAQHLGVLLQLEEELPRLLLAPMGEQDRGMRRRGAEQWLGDAHAALPLRIDQVPDALRPLLLRAPIAC